MKLEIKIPAYTLMYEKTDLKKTIRAAAQEVAAEARRLIRGQTPPSQPGQPPANRTGNLAREIAVRTGRDTETGVSMKITDSAKYATALETGAKGGGGIKGNRNKRGKPSTIRVLEARPFLETALKNKSDSISSRVEASLKNGIKFVKEK
jgi:alkaline phosphatase